MHRISRWATVLITMAMLLANPLAGNLARAADGDGDGSGGGQNNPLAIESSIPANGATGVSDLEYIKIVFTKNIAYMTIRESNRKCFALWSEGQRIPAEIIIADDQIEREKRNDVLVKPLQPLKAGATYRVEIAPELQSKSGVFLGQKAAISFTMAGGSPTSATGATGADSPILVPDTGVDPGEVVKATSPVTPEAAATPRTASPAVEQDSVDQGIGTEFWLWIALGAAAVGLAGWYYRKSKQP